MGEELKTMEELKIIKELRMIEEIRKVERLDSIKAIYSFHGDTPNGIIRMNEETDKKTKKEKNKKEKNNEKSKKNNIEEINDKANKVSNIKLFKLEPIKVEPEIEDISSSLVYLSKLELSQSIQNDTNISVENTVVQNDELKQEKPNEIKEKPPEESNTITSSAINIAEPQPILNNPMMVRRPTRRNSNFRMGINLMR
jgi:hypothetical protein